MMKVINTRPADRNQELSLLLRQAGFEPVEIPLVDIRPHEEGLTKARSLPPSGFTGVFLSSPNGLRHFREALLVAEFERWSRKPFYLVGQAARALVEEAGGTVAFVPEEASLAGFLKEWKSVTEPGKLPMAQRWLHPCSLSTRLDPAEFRKRGVEVVNLPVYRPCAPEDAGQHLAQADGEAAAVIFCSGSAVETYFQAAPEAASRLGLAKGPLAVSLGTSTTDALRARGVQEVHQALHPDDASLVDVLKDALGSVKTEILRKPDIPKHAAPPAPAPEKIP